MTVYAPLTLVPPMPPLDGPPPGVVLPEQLTSPYSFPDVRVRFRQPVTADGFIDAVWWPRTADLAQELPDLLDLVWMAGRDIRRVAYNLDAWGQQPRKMTIGERTVRLGGFRTSDPQMIRLSDSRGQERIDLLIIPPDAYPGYARRLMHLATAAGEARRANELMAAAAENQAMYAGTARDPH